MQKVKKVISVVLCVLLISSLLIPCVSAADEEKNYIIDNPYDVIDWDSWNAYKTQLHAHTNASDGFLTIHEFVQEHYDRDYDIVALTDHGTVNYGWNQEPDLVTIMRLVKYERTQNSDIIPLTEEEYAAYLGGTAESDTRTHSNGMLDVPYGNELNFATPFADCHLTSYFAPYGQGDPGVFGDYETPAANVAALDGVTMLSHVGEYVYIDKDSEKYVGQPVDDYYASKFARIFLDNPGSSLGMGINSATDAHTRCDRILYDQVLAKTIPNGVVPWGFTFSDSHTADSVNYAYTMTMMDSFDIDTFRESMENGLFFSVSHFTNGVELNGMAEMPGYVEEEMDYESNDTPMVTRIEVDQDNDTITVEGINFDMITWVSGGNVILRQENITDGKATLDLHSDELLDEPYMFVRFYIVGEDGICYSNPMVLNVEGETFENVDVPETKDISTFLRKVLNFFNDMIFSKSVFVDIFKKTMLGIDD